MSPNQYFASTVQKQVLLALRQSTPAFDFEQHAPLELIARIESANTAAEAGESWIAIAHLWQSGDEATKASIKSSLSSHLVRICQVAPGVAHKMSLHWLELLCSVSHILLSPINPSGLPLLPETQSSDNAEELWPQSEEELVSSLASESPFVRLKACLRFAVDGTLASAHQEALKSLLKSEPLEAIRALATKALNKCNQPQL